MRMLFPFSDGFLEKTNKLGSKPWLPLNCAGSIFLSEFHYIAVVHLKRNNVFPYVEGYKILSDNTSNSDVLRLGSNTLHRFTDAGILEIS